VLVRLGLLVAAVGLGGLLFALWRRTPRIARLEPAALGFSGPAIVQFGTPECAPCKQARPFLSRAAAESGVAFVDVDVAARPEIASRYRIRSVPLIVVAAPDGSVLGRFTGLPPEREVRRLAARAVAA
jgi:thioredoxin-like negative regulator of GroEL